MATMLLFTEEEMVVDEVLGYPKAYAKLCRSANHSSFYAQGPPFAFFPYSLPVQEAIRAKDLDQMFPVVDPKATPSMNPTGFINLLWKQLSHLGNAGFDPALFRVDPYGNVLYFHADPASPLSWDIDPWFPCSRGGRTAPSNLRLLQWQVCRKKHNKLEFLIPWWDLQLGISVNQFLSIFASKNSDFRNRAFSFLFMEGGNEELNELQVVESHRFPQHFKEMKRQVGLAPAAIVLSQSYSNSSVLKALALKHRSSSVGGGDTGGLSKAIHRARPSLSKENDNPNIDSNGNNPYLSIAQARDSLRQMEEAKKIQAEMGMLDDELNVLKQSNESERLSLQELETALVKKRRRVEKSRRLAEAQSTYKSLLEKMIRDAMHQSVVYKEQLRLNQAASSALMARLEAQRAICDSSEKELHRKYKQRDELEKQTRPSWEQARKRSRVDGSIFDERQDTKAHSFSAGRIPWKPSKKELRQFLEEEQKAYEASLTLFDAQGEEAKEENAANTTDVERKMECSSSTFARNEIIVDDKLKKPTFEVGSRSKSSRRKKLSVSSSSLTVDDDEEHRTQLGKDNVDRWVHMLFGDAKESTSAEALGPENHTEEIVRKLNATNPQKDMKFLRLRPSEEKARSSFSCHGEQTRETCGDHSSKVTGKRDSNVSEDVSRTKAIEVKGMEGKRGGRGPASARPDSPRSFRSFPSSPSMILGMKRGMDCIRKPVVVGDDEVNDIQSRK